MTALIYFLGVAPPPVFRTAVTVCWTIAAALLLGLMFIDCFRDYGRGD